MSRSQICSHRKDHIASLTPISQNPAAFRSYYLEYLTERPKISKISFDSLQSFSFRQFASWIELFAAESSYSLDLVCQISSTTPPICYQVSAGFEEGYPRVGRRN